MKAKLLFLLFLASFSSFGQYVVVPHYVAKNGLIAYYPFNGNANDESGNQNHAIVNGATLTTDKDNNLNSAYSFDGLNSFIEANITNYPLKGESRSITGWFKAKTPLVSKELDFCLLNYGNITDPNYWFKISFYRKGYLDLQFDSKTAESQENYFNDVWTFFALTFDDGTNTYSLYINGVYKIGGTADLYTNGVGNYFRIGRNKLNNYFEGKIDDIGIWNRVLSIKEMSDLFTKTNKNPPPPTGITNIPDVNFEKKLISIGLDSGNPDGKVPTSQISFLTNLNIASSSISDLTGIQDFKALQTLNISNNQLTNLDLTTNLALNSLDCSSNQLRSIDVTKNVALTNLDCGLNQLTSLGVANNLYLNTLSCYSNQLTSLDVSNNTVLTSLSCHSNQLTNLNLKNGKNTSLNLLNNASSAFTNNPNLTCIQVDNVIYSNTNWSELKDATARYTTSCTAQQYTLIPDLNFEKKLIALGIDSGNTDGKVPTSDISDLTNLNIANSSISNLTGIQDFKALQTLNISSNQLTSLDITNNLALNSLDCSSNQLTSLDIAKNVALTNLDCGLNQLTSLDVSKNIALTSLSCHSNQLTSLDITNNLSLNALSCYSNQFTSLDVSKNTVLTSLSCTSNQLTSLDVSKNIALVSLYCDSNQLKTLDISENIVLKSFSCGSNQLTSLNLKNGKNTLLASSPNYEIFFKNNPNLSCIQVDDVAYSNANWATFKDAAANYNTSCAVQQYTLIPDLNFEKKLIALGIDSGATDGKVLTSSISSLTSLNISSASIANITGIQDFVALTSLNCGYNNLTSLDVSKNIALTSLSCYSNSLKSIDVSMNTAFISLNCDSNKITTLDVSKNLSLTSLSCNSNTLSVLDVSKNLSLTSLSCYSNLLTVLNTSNNTALTSLSCSSNSLTSLDVSKNVDLTSLFCSLNPLTSLDVSKNVALTSLSCSSNQLISLDVSKNVALTSLSCYSNQIKTLDISDNIGLISLLCYSNQLTSLNLKNGKNTLLASSPNYEISFINNPNLTCIQVDDAIYSNTKWSTFKDATASYNTSCAAQQYTLIPDVNFEKKLIALGIDSGATDGKVLTSSISSLTSLDVSSSSIKDMTGIQDFATLTSLTCYSNQLTFLDISKNVALSSLLCYLNQLTSLDISRNVALKTLTCSSNQLTSLDISQNVALTRLSCNSNQLTSLDVSKNVALTTLVFDSNQLTTLDISKNTKLIALYCISNKLTSLDVSKNVALKDLFCYSNQLKSLDVSNNTALENLLCQINQLTVLDVYKNTSLKLLDCSFNKLITLDISDNVSLFALNCNSNQLINLNLRNGNNTILANSKSSNFANNPNLTCIEVDNVTYSNTNWATLKDTAASYSTSCTVQKYTLIPDLNFEKKLIALGIDSGATDRKVLTSSVSSLTSLDVSSSSIKDLTGIQDFVGLTNLNCYNNQLTNIDVTKNIALTSLYCFSNKLTTLDVSKNLYLNTLYCYSNQLTSLDVSKNLSLNTLYCYSNQLTSLDVSKNISMTLLNCSTNQLTGLDLSKNVALIYLYCNSNYLTSLNLNNGKNTLLNGKTNLKNNPNLTCIQVDDVAYANANWSQAKDATASYNTSCSVQQYTLIPDLNFEKKLIALGIDSGATDGKVLTASISSLTSLNVSSASITNLTGIQDFVGLTNLNCFNNQLTSLDVSKNIALTSLDCSYNSGLNVLDLSKNITLTSLKSNGNSKLLTLDISKNLDLTDLECSYVNLTTLDVSKNTSLLALKCFNNKLTTLDVTKNNALKFLNCGSNQLLAIDVSNNVALDTLRCNSNKLVTLDLSKNVNLKRLFCSNNKLESLNLKNGNNSKIDVNNYNLGFSYNPDLTCIQVDDKTYSDANWSTFKDATASYSDNCPPPSIIVSSEFEDKLIALGIDKDGKNGSVLLADITNVTSIDVSNSGITNLSGIEYFKDLVTLICKGNLLTTINLSSNTALKYLDCSSNPLTALDVSKNILLTELYFNGLVIKLNKINNAKTSVTTQLTVLDLSNNLFLTKLNCSNNQLVSLDVSKNTLLTDIDCSNNSLQNLNVNNGNNTKMLNVNFKSNSSLSCIKVDDALYSNNNWAGAKDATAIYSKTACTLGIEDVVSDKIAIYPNPVKGQLHIDNIVLEKVTVYDALGKLIKTIKFTNASESNTVDLNGLTKGVYFIYLQSQGTNSARKIIIE